MIGGTDIQPALGNLLRARRHEAGKTLRQVGGTALSHTYLQHIETGRIQDVSVSKFLTLCRVYNVPIPEVLGRVYGVDLEGNEVNAEALALGETILGVLAGDQAVVTELAAFKAQRPTEPAPDPQAVAIGETVLGLPDYRRELLIGYIDYQKSKAESEQP